MLLFTPTISVGGGGGYSGPTFKATGSARHSISSINVPWPAGHAIGDMGVMLITNRGNDSLWTPTNGWTKLTDFRSGSTSGNVRGHIYYKIATSTSESDAAVGDLGNFQAAQIYTFDNCSNIAQLGTNVNSSGSSVSITSGTTGGNDRMLLGCAFFDQDTTTDQITSWTNANLTNLTDRGGVQTTDGGGGGFDICSGELETSGAGGTFTATAAGSGKYVGCTVELW